MSCFGHMRHLGFLVYDDVYVAYLFCWVGYIVICVWVSRLLGRPILFELYACNKFGLSATIDAKARVKTNPNFIQLYIVVL